MHLATDVGGTFTDFVLLREGGLVTFKLPSIPGEPQVALERGLRRSLEPSLEPRLKQDREEGLDLRLRGTLQNGHERSIGSPEASGLEVFSHASTVATNAVLERKGAKVAFITTRGFGDLLHIGRQDRPRLYDFDARRVEPLVSRQMCFEVNERLGPDGAVLVPLEEAEARKIVNEARKAGAQALAVCLLHSYANPVHELKLARAANNAGLPCTRSSQVWSEYREYERATTTVMDAMLRPVMVGYIRSLQELLKERAAGAVLRLMVSSGATSPVMPHRPGDFPNPVELLLSGPAGGVAAAAHRARKMGETGVVTLDMGGTSTDVALLMDGRPALSTGGSVAGLPVRLPRVAIETVGAGGGSIARIVPGGTLQVGPRSAGSRPGPASYGLGGEDLTVTDALLLVGWLPPLELPGGINLRPELALKAARPLAKVLGLPVERLALGVLEVALATMMRPLEALTVRQGHDPRELTLMAFGGAGPLLACNLARRLGCGRVIIPLHAGIFSALGLVLAPVRFMSSSSLMVTTALGHDPLEKARRRLVRALKGQATNFDLDPAEGVWEWSVDCRYQGQSHELSVPTDDPPSPLELELDFHALHQRTNGYAFPERSVELVALRGSLSFPASIPELSHDPIPAPAPTSASASPAWELEHGSDNEPNPVFWEREWLKAPILQRDRLPRESHLQGPAVVLEAGSTTFVPPGWRGRVDRWSNLILEVSNGD